MLWIWRKIVTKPDSPQLAKDTLRLDIYKKVTGMFKKITEFINQPFMLVIITAFFSSWLTTYINYQYQERVERKHQQYEIHKTQQTSLATAGQQIAIAIGQRKFALYRVISVLNDNRPQELSDRWDNYYHYVTDWNNYIFVYEMLLQELCDTTTKQRCVLLDAVNKQFVITHQALLAWRQCIAEAKQGQCMSYQNRVNLDYEVLNQRVDDFITSLKV